MFGSAVLDIAIGITLLYVLVASIASAVQELAAAVLATRAKVLFRALGNMLDDPRAKGLLNRFLTHSVIEDISDPKIHRRGKPGVIARTVRREGAGRPSYIPAGTFCDVLMDLVIRAAPPPTVPAGQAAAASPMTTTAGTPSSGLLPLPPAVGTRVVLGRPVLDALYKAVDALPESGPKRAMVIAINDSRGDIDRARAGIEAWFNGTMDRASGWYKRRAQAFLSVYAIAIVVLLNADTIMVGRTLAADPTLRSAVAEYATGYANVSPELPEDCPDGPEPTDAELSAAHLQRLLAVTEQSRLPIGWVLAEEQESDDPVIQTAAAGDPRRCPRTATEWAMKVLGLLLTILAASLGAPFWFDLMNKLVNLRGTGRPPDPRAAEPPPSPGPPPFPVAGSTAAAPNAGNAGP